MCAILYVTLTQETGSSFQEMRPGKHFCVLFISDPQDPGVLLHREGGWKGAVHGQGWDGRCLWGEGFMKISYALKIKDH